MTQSDQLAEIRIAVMSSCNLDLLGKPLSAALRGRGFAAQIRNTGFDQYRQEILDPASGLYAFEPHAVLLFLDAADLFADLLRDPFSQPEELRREAVAGAIEQVRSLTHVLIERLPAATICLNTLALDGTGCSWGLEFNSEFSLRSLVADYNEALGALCREAQSLAVLDVESLAASFGLNDWYDARLWYVGRIRLGMQAHMVLAEEYANALAARLGRSGKCIVLDLDNTLWGGIIGEDGVAGIQLGNEGAGLAFAEFQRELLHLYRKGVLLAVCSRNNPEDALEAIRNHPAMVLREEYFSALRVNWLDKCDNLRDIARELNIGFDSMVFLDDSPVERDRVRQELPDVLVPDWPADPGDYRRALLAIGRRHFLKFRITEEDLARGEMYRAQVERQKLASSADSLPDFYRSLQMAITIGTADEKTIPRIAQLMQKTNQFNLTARRYTEAQVAALAKSPSARVYWLDLTDRFGANGIIGVVVARRHTETEWVLDTFLLSCRVIGRSVEDAFVAFVAEDLAAAGVRVLAGEFIPTGKNDIAAGLYDRLGFTRQAGDGDPMQIWRLDLVGSPMGIPDWFEVRSALAAAV